ncbi:hypothetical protein HPP92_007887 [Vanilla planifolia]|uniref:RING-type E3 ubiquitin transferase n=1 Tax=Vanilla planifolia TaxID=51239 RepID=A0A835RL25_VANPL|nr:hypothetical protein HPP92_007887 [Vanilla planifolia]
MGQRSTLCTSQMLDLGSDPCNVLHHEHHFFARNASDFTNRNGYPIIQAPGNSMNLCHQLTDYQENLMFYGNDHINVPNHQTIQNLGFGATGPNFYNPNMLLAPSGRIFPVHRSDMMAEQLTSSFGQTDNGINMDETSRHRQVFDGVLSCKRKNFAMIPGNNYYNFNGSASSSSTTSFGVPQWGHSYETLQQVVDATNFAIPEFEGYLTGPYRVDQLLISPRTGDVIDVGATFSHFPCGQFPPSSVDQLYWYQQLPRPAQQFNNGNQRFPPAEDATLMDLSALYGTRNAIDQHQDMRLDIDDMSYEELLALEERIEIVKTGLTEEFIARNLKNKGSCS